MNSYTQSNFISEKLIFFSFPKISLRTIQILVFVFVGFLLIFYVFQIHEITKANFSLLVYQKKIAEIARENKSLENNFSQSNSLAGLEAFLKNSNYEKVGRVYYIRMPESEVAVK